MNNYFMYHCHSDLSNATTTMDSVTKVKDYVQKAKENDMKALCFSEHGNLLSWLDKKTQIEDAGMKYVHGIEVYVTKSLEEKVRDNYHTILMAKNYDGVKEINNMMSDKLANNREDGHFYYTPRITYDELKQTSDNVIITTACLGGIFNSEDDELKRDFLRFLVDNKHRSFLEIQHHNVADQIIYNKMLVEMSEKTGLRLIAGTDTHNLDELHAEGRVVLQKSKHIHFSNEEDWDLNFKTYDELVEAYEIQDSVPEEIYMEAIENTNVLADMIEEFTLDKGYKYPQLHDNPEAEFKKKIAQGIKERGIDLDKEKQDRINRELGVMKENGSIDYMLLEEDYKKWCREEDIAYGFGRGSVSGSYIAYLLQVTEMDSIKHKLIFERFMNKERVSLCD